MEPIKATLCPFCTACPEVEISDQGVTIGEDANTVRLCLMPSGMSSCDCRTGSGQRGAASISIPGADFSTRCVP